MIDSWAVHVAHGGARARPLLDYVVAVVDVGSRDARDDPLASPPLAVVPEASDIVPAFEDSYQAYALELKDNTYQPPEQKQDCRYGSEAKHHLEHQWPVSTRLPDSSLHPRNSLSPV